MVAKLEQGEIHGMEPILSTPRRLLSAASPQCSCAAPSLQKTWFMALPTACCQQAQDFHWLHSLRGRPQGSGACCQRPALCWSSWGCPMSPGLASHCWLPPARIQAHCVVSGAMPRAEFTPGSSWACSLTGKMRFCNWDCSFIDTKGSLN